MPNEALNAFIAHHVATPDGTCSCGWDIANYDLDRPGGWGRPLTRTEAWVKHITKASYTAFPSKQYAEVIGPDGDTVVLTMESQFVHAHEGGSADRAREDHEKYGYSYDDFVQPERDPDDISRSETCEEAGCRNPSCLGGHVSVRVSFPKQCARCGEDFGDEPRVGVMLQAPAGTPIENKAAIAVTATYHQRCEPTEEEVAARAEELWPTPAPIADDLDPEMRQAMACLTCGLAGVTPEDHFPQEPGLWDQPCPDCGAMTVWVTEPG